ncbi:hypothetical protein Z517_12439 [Fonsecaea pedrosoi CBS 271.37]|uniref:Uncharacterized protein n=1 Tax=Fonsecaea pedrosoi CBS 271.37 TaxID=1442368 RepID=A0A0D2GQ62_9EURO|nr:uncharacterized protein Z517_12439 [Fonsecaea pedrosoi CBS 271.37]KIW74499.1 hypothetical protein Z517_12439 [Fonsecaea pedrosoi CBS 271.37]
MTAILAHTNSTSALPVADSILLPKITIRQDSSPRSPSQTAPAPAPNNARFVRHGGTHGKRQQDLPSEEVEGDPTSNSIILMPTQGTRSQPMYKRGNRHPPMARFYPFDRGNETSFPNSQTSPLNNGSSGTQPSTGVTSPAVALSNGTSTSPNNVTDTYTSAPNPRTDTTIVTVARIQTLPPTTALSTNAPPPLPEPQPNLVTQSQFSGTTATLTTSQRTRNPNCPSRSGIPPVPDPDTTSSPIFPVIVTVFPVSTGPSTII